MAEVFEFVGSVRGFGVGVVASEKLSLGLGGEARAHTWQPKG